MNQLTHIKIIQPKTSRGEKTRQKILLAAEIEFGEKGFHDASVSGITTRATIGQGTFYLYFKSKEQVLRELVDFMGRNLRNHLTTAIAKSDNRIDAEETGIREFFNYIKQHKNLYRIVLESQFVDESVYKNYYERFAQGYISGLKLAQQDNELKAGDAAVWAWALMGMVHFLGMKYVLWDKSNDIDAVTQSAMSLLKNGLFSDTATTESPSK